MSMTRPKPDGHEKFSSVVTTSVGEPETAAPGSSTVGLGAWLSTVTETAAEVVELPAASVARTAIETGPSPTEVESQPALAASQEYFLVGP